MVVIPLSFRNILMTNRGPDCLHKGRNKYNYSHRRISVSDEAMQLASNPTLIVVI